jgi:hypothetical protein
VFSEVVRADPRPSSSLVERFLKSSYDLLTYQLGAMLFTARVGSTVRRQLINCCRSRRSFGVSSVCAACKGVLWVSFPSSTTLCFGTADDVPSLLCRFAGIELPPSHALVLSPFPSLLLWPLSRILCSCPITLTNDRHPPLLSPLDNHHLP